MVNNAIKRNGIPVTRSEPSIELNPMDLDVVRGVLTLPGIVGLTFLDRAVPVQVFSWDVEFTIQAPEIFITSVTQVLQSMPTTFYQFEFEFGSYCVSLRRLITGDAIAFVLRTGIDLEDYKIELARFYQVVMNQPSSVRAELQAHQARYLQTRQPCHPEAVSAIAQQVFIRAFNQLAAMAGRYLGTAIMTRHLLRSRPTAECLDCVTIDRKGQLTISNREWLDAEQSAAFSEWIQCFVRECSKIIRNFDRLAREEGLTEEEIEILFPNPSFLDP